MLVGGLPIPKELLDLLESGRWPRSVDEENQQNLRALISEERVRNLAAEESRIFLYSPPFTTIASEIRGSGKSFYAQWGALPQIVPALAIVIADFGLGSDSPIILDYRMSPTSPQVLRLRWSEPGQENNWAMMTPDFRTFVEALGL